MIPSAKTILIVRDPIQRAISHFEHLVEHEGMTWSLDTAIRGASERLVPITMTALVTTLAAWAYLGLHG